ncbi:polyprenyl synthetase family protein [Amycolatopsis sp. PS_44_ISF1]|uniref:polyprenyl synthetase family protein n=1 Tax=Amycolatopsis sp. PS_44_ISF1 TaxID=2974917 RepID=UPI0028EED982|nr:polyprenyl synthetase family protein [Amycolatopsis sp. PS_44_ISF1]
MSSPPPGAGPAAARAGAVEDLRATVGLQIEDEQLLRSIAGGLAEVETLLRDVVKSDVQAVHDAALHLVEAGGKRFRPLFTLLSSQFGPKQGEPVVVAAAAVELVHLATLYHDDVMDEATMRRGAESVNARWDNTVAILTGDFLFAHASRLVADLGTDAARIIAETFGELVTGQMRETVGPGPGDDPVEHYLTVIAQKTGSLIATSGRFGGMMSGAEGDHVQALRRFGDIVGTAFQISDDIIDIASPSAELGKAQGTDLREGVRTLPMLYALADPDTDPRLTELLAGPIAEDALVEEALELLRRSSGLERARVTLSDYASRARSELAALPASPARDACESVADHMVARTH